MERESFVRAMRNVFLKSFYSEDADLDRAARLYYAFKKSEEQIAGAKRRVVVGDDEVEGSHADVQV